MPHTYFASLFSGRFELTSDAKGAYFIDRDGKNFHYILNFLRDSGSFKLSSNMMEELQRDELAVELEFYGLLDRMMPFYSQERIGRALLQRACRTGTKRELRPALAQVRALVFEIGSTTPFLTDEFQDLRFVITDRIVNGSPVWAAEDGELFMYRDIGRSMMIGNKYDCVEGSFSGVIYNTQTSVAPTDLPSDKWMSDAFATLESQYPSAERIFPGLEWVRVPCMRVTVVHGLNDGDPAMTMALCKLAALV